MFVDDIVKTKKRNHMLGVSIVAVNGEKQERRPRFVVFGGFTVVLFGGRRGDKGKEERGRRLGFSVQGKDDGDSLVVSAGE